METSIRHAAFAGKFYPRTATEIASMFDSMDIDTTHTQSMPPLNHLIGAVTPHAGYVYSGHHAAPIFNILRNHHTLVETFVVINPNHTGIGSGNFNVSGVDFWETPLGQIESDKEFIEALNIEVNELAHQSEHSGEVQLPFLQHFIPSPFKIVMITLNRQTPDNAVELAKRIAQARQRTNRNIFILASSDFSHYEHPLTGFEKDQMVVNEILELNTEQIFNQVKRHSVTACGFGCIMALTAYAKAEYKNPQMKVLSRGHSGEIHSSTQVVDYISMLCFDAHETAF
ncbi:MAG: AmmeMemoRadiSam system protein B [Prolixibacteraceae bacterium]|nr:AmmeMemoRadiSam system protein B [Prolixibacteraceae bacterium]MBN2649385.1 AmmeMemoRadiSam system protein B [Prolixibacteraceae bacterium]